MMKAFLVIISIVALIFFGLLIWSMMKVTGESDDQMERWIENNNRKYDDENIIS